MTTRFQPRTSTPPPLRQSGGIPSSAGLRRANIRSHRTAMAEFCAYASISFRRFSNWSLRAQAASTSFLMV